MNTLSKKVCRLLCCLLALCCWLTAGRASAADDIQTVDDLRAIFPNISAVGSPWGYTMQLDRAEIFILSDGLSQQPSIVLITIQHPNNKKKAMTIAKRLAGLISKDCIVIPSCGKGNGAAIIPPFRSGLSFTTASPAQAIFARPTDDYRKQLKAVGWKDGIMLVQIALPRGEVELGLNPIRMTEVLQMRRMRGKVDFYQFIASPARMPYSSGGQYTSALASGRSYLDAKHVISYVSGEFCIASKNKKIYYAGTPSYVRRALEEGFTADPIPYLSQPSEWPNDSGADSAEEDDGNDTPTPAEEQHEDDTPAEDETPEQLPALPALQKELQKLTPEEALKKYLQTLHFMY